MENSAAPIPSTPPQPVVPFPDKTADYRWLLWSVIGLTFLIFGTALGVFGVKFLNQSTTQSQISTYNGSYDQIFSTFKFISPSG